jgi:hypothetical protein
VAGITPADVLSAVESVMFRHWDWSCDHHCLGDASDVFRALWGVDPMAAIRGKARSFCGAVRVVGGFGGMDGLADTLFPQAGLARQIAAPGAIAIGPSGGRIFGGRVALICIKPGFWAGKSDGGFSVIQWNGNGWRAKDAAL